LKRFAIVNVNFADQLPNESGFRTIKSQIFRSGPVCAANYRAACRAKSTRDFIYKLSNVEEELDETMFWLEFTVGLKEDNRAEIKDLWIECDELLEITVSSIRTAKQKSQGKMPSE